MKVWHLLQINHAGLLISMLEMVFAQDVLDDTLLMSIGNQLRVSHHEIINRLLCDSLCSGSSAMLDPVEYGP